MSEPDEGFLSRWSRRKIEAREEPAAVPQSEPTVNDKDAVPRGDAALPASGDATQPQPPLPPLESLTPDSDFAPFMRGGVDPAVKGEALKTLFSDPALYPMDGLDVYIDDYSKPDPLPEGWLEKLQQFAHLHAQPAPVEPAVEELAAAAPAALESDASDAVVAPAALPDASASDTSREDPTQPDSNNRGTI